jgi:predicted RNase H-like HicB family nuclease
VFKMTNNFIYPVVVEKASDGGYGLYFPDFPGTGIVTDDVVDGVRKAKEMLISRILELEERGWQPPSPSEPDVIDNLDPSDRIVFVDVFLPPYREEAANKAVTKNCTMPKWLKETGEDAGLNFSQLLQSAIKEALGIKSNRWGTVTFTGVDWSKVNYLLTPDGFKYYLKDFRLDYEAAYLGKLELFRILGDEGNEIHELTEDKVKRIVRYGDHAVHDYTSIVKELGPAQPNSEILPDLDTLKTLRDELLRGKVSAAQVVVRMLRNQSSEDQLWEVKRQLLIDAINDTSDTIQSLRTVLFD